MTIAVCYPDTYPVEETFELLKVPWVWFEKGVRYDVVIARKSDVPGYEGPLIDLTNNDFFQKIRILLNTGKPHLHKPECDILIDQIRKDLLAHCLLCEIPPVPWGHPYLVALTHDVDVTSVRECRILTVGNAAWRCVKQGDISSGIRLFSAWCGIGADPWVLFGKWMAFEGSLGVRSTFFFVPQKGVIGIRGHKYRSVGYEVPHAVLDNLTSRGWEAGVHGIDNWADAEAGQREITSVGRKNPGNRTHWLLFETASWERLDRAGYSYDTSFGYNDDAGFRAGTLQVYRPEHAGTLLELPLHIQDLGLFGTSCWAPSSDGWERVPCLTLSQREAEDCCENIFAFARSFGGVVTLLWHYESITPPRDWSGLYYVLVTKAKEDGAWITNAGNAVGWFRKRRQVRITPSTEGSMMVFSVEGDLPRDPHPPLTLRLYIPADRDITVNSPCRRLSGYTDIRLDQKRITVTLA